MYPDYLEEIQQPMSLDVMRRKVDSRAYISINHFKEDFELILSNCRKYNKTRNPWLIAVANDFETDGCKILLKGD